VSIRRFIPVSNPVDPPSSDFVPLVGLADGLRAIFEGNRLADPRGVESLRPIEEHYRRLSERLGVALEPARDYYQRCLAIQPNDASLIRRRLAEVEQAIAKK